MERRGTESLPLGSKLGAGEIVHDLQRDARVTSTDCLDSKLHRLSVRSFKGRRAGCVEKQQNPITLGSPKLLNSVANAIYMSLQRFRPLIPYLHTANTLSACCSSLLDMARPTSEWFCPGHGTQCAC